MPISWESHHRIEELIRPYGRRKWQDVVADKARQALSGRNHSVVLEAGCGRECWITTRLRKEGISLRVLGVDTDPSCLENQDVDEAHVASLVEMPFDSESVDLVMAGWVVEHLDAPESALREMHRVIKPGGTLILWTPNAHNPAIMISHLTPHWFHVWIRRLNMGDEHADNAETYYRLNTLGKIKSAAERCGYVYEYGCVFSGMYQYFRMNRLTYLMACILNKPARLWPLNRLGLTLVVVLTKPGDKPESNVSRGV